MNYNQKEYENRNTSIECKWQIEKVDRKKGDDIRRKVRSLRPRRLKKRLDKFLLCT